LLLLIQTKLTVLETAVRIIVLVRQMVHVYRGRVEVPQDVVRRVWLLLMINHHRVRLEQRVQVVVFLVCGSAYVNRTQGFQLISSLM